MMIEMLNNRLTFSFPEVHPKAELSVAKGDIALPENQSVTPDNLVVYRKGLKHGQVREGAF